MTDKLHLTDSELRELLLQLSHDVRNPLAAIVTNIEFARRLVQDAPGLDTDLVESIEDSVVACDVLRRIVSNFELLVKGRNVSVTFNEFDVAPLVREVVKRCQGSAQQAGLTLVLSGDDIAPRALIDRNMLALALENLVSNSMQYAPRGSRIEVRMHQNDKTATVSVRDDGPAIPEAGRELALSVAGQSPAGRREELRYGRGLGLLVVRAACMAAGIELAIGGDDSSSEMSMIMRRVTSG